MPRALLLASLLAVLVVLAIRIRFLDLPLERDEGEYAYGGQLLLGGGRLFRDLYTLKFPGAHAAYAAVLLLLGESVRAVRLGLLLFNLGAATCVAGLTRRLFGLPAAVVAGAAYVLLSASLAVLGLFAHATQILVLPMVAGIWALHVALERPSRAWPFFLSGTLLGLAVLVKQHAAVFVLFAAVMAGWELRRAGRKGVAAVGILLLGATVPLLLLMAAVAATHSFQAFWFWCFRYARAYVSLMAPGAGLQTAAMRLLSIGLSSPLLCALAVWGAFHVGRERRFLGGWLLAALAAAAPGLYFREHYFVPFLAVLAVLAGAGTTALPARLRVPAVSALLIASALYPLWWHEAVLLERDPARVMHRALGSNPFPEAAVMAGYLRRKAVPGERLAVLGSEPEIFFLSGLPSATGYVYMYGLMEPQPHARAMQDDLIRRLEASPPAWVVEVVQRLSWLPRPESDPHLTEWIPGWLHAHYRVEGVADMLSPIRTKYVWGAEAAAYRPQSPSFLVLLRRRDAR